MILLAYEVAGKYEELGRLHSLWAHETRVFTASLDAFQSISVGDIMAACRRRSHNIFTSFYLRDLVEMEARLLVLKSFPPAASSLKVLEPAPPAWRDQEGGSLGVFGGFFVQWLSSV